MPNFKQFFSESNQIRRNKKNMWSIMKSPRAIAFLKLGAASIAFVHALDEFLSASPSKTQIGFHDED